MSDWSRSSEKWSDPLLIIKSSSSDDKENDKKEEFAANFGNNGYAILDDDDEATLLQRTSGGTSHMIYKDFLGYNDDEIAQGINGQTGTSDEKSFVGSAEVHERILGDYTEERLRSLMYYINETALPFLIEKGYKLEGYSWKPLQFMKELKDPNEMPDPNDPANQNQPKGVGGSPEKKQLALSLNPDYETCQCGNPEHHSYELAYGSPFNLDYLVQRSLIKIYDRKLKEGKVDAALWRANAEKIMQGASEAFAKKLNNMKYGSSEHTLYSHIRHNIHVTSVFKNYHNTLEMAAALFDENGNMRTYPQFLKAVKPIAEVFNKNYLSAEYQTAVASARSASKWQGFVDRGGKLMYKTQGDGRVRDEHTVLDRVVKPVTDSFWDSFYPPNGWRCRCFVRWVPETEPDVSPESVPDLKPMFKNNVGKTGKVFTAEHPYFKTDAQDAKQAQRVWGQKLPISPDKLKNNIDLYQSLKENGNYSLEYVDNLSGGFVFRHLKSNKKELKELLRGGKLIAVQENEAVVINQIVEGVKNPDLTVGLIPVEYKTVTTPTASAIDIAIRNAKNQAASVAIEIASDMNTALIEEAIYNRVQRSLSLTEVRIIVKGKVYFFTRKEIVDRSFIGKIK